MNDSDLDRLVAEASPVSDAVVFRFDLGSGELDLQEAIMSNLVPTRRRRRSFALGGAAALVAAAASVAGVLVVGRDGHGGGSAYAAELVAVAEANERLLVGLPGWAVTRADEFAVDRGEMTFSDGEHDLELRWGPASDYQAFVDDRTHPNSGATPVGSVTVVGRPGTMFRYEGPADDYTTLVEPAGAHYLEIRGDLGGEQPYRDALTSLHAVDVTTWLDAMPASVVKPDARRTVVDQMLADVPLPPGLDRATLSSSTNVSDRYQLGAEVTGAVACGWFEQWFTATEQGDTATAAAASEALRSSHEWTVLQEMTAEGAWPEVLWQFADATAGGAVETGGGPYAPTRENVTSALGCEALLETAADTTVP